MALIASQPGVTAGTIPAVAEWAEVGRGGRGAARQPAQPSLQRAGKHGSSA